MLRQSSSADICKDVQKQLSRGVLRKRCSENMDDIYRRTPMSKCDFNKVSLKLLAWVFSCNLLYIFRTTFYKTTSAWLLLDLHNYNKKLCKIFAKKDIATNDFILRLVK